MVSKPLTAHNGRRRSIPSPLLFDAPLDQPVRFRHQGVTIGREQDRRTLPLSCDEGDPAGLRLTKPDPMIHGNATCGGSSHSGTPSSS